MTYRSFDIHVYVNKHLRIRGDSDLSTQSIGHPSHRVQFRSPESDKITTVLADIAESNNFTMMAPVTNK